MAKRLQVILKDPEYREIQRVARSRRMVADRFGVSWMIYVAP